MKILDRYLLFSILKIAFVTILIFALILAAVELFSKMDQIMNLDVPPMRIVEYVLLSLPEYLMMVASISLLFATTYFLSSLTANNEIIALLNGGISKFRLSIPIMILAVILTLFGFLYQELLLNRIIARHDEVEVELFGRSSTQDARNIVLRDEKGYIVFTNRFDEDRVTIFNPILVKVKDDKLSLRIEASYATYSDGNWVFYNARVYEIDEEKPSSYFSDEYINEDFDMEPHLFRSENTKVETMDGSTARQYLKRLKVVDPNSYQEKSTDYLRSFFQPLAIFVLMFISVTMNYRFKKNVLLFCIIQSLSIAVVYYVADMVFSIASHQGVIMPWMSVFFPILITLLLAWILSLFTKRLN